MSQPRPPDNVVPFRPRGGREPWVTARRLADHFQVSVRTVQRWKARGLPCLDVGGTVRYRISDAESWLPTVS
jgi:phage terminase Nu1 subunit (DNA packaging protein)